MVSISQTQNVIQNLDGKTMAILMYGDGRPWMTVGGMKTIGELTGLTHTDLIDYIGFKPSHYVYNSHVMHKYFLEPWLKSRDNDPGESFINFRNSRFIAKIKNLPVKRILLSDLAFTLRSTDDDVEQFMRDQFNIHKSSKAFVPAYLQKDIKYVLNKINQEAH